MSYLHKHPKNGGFWFQRGVPARIRHIIKRGTTYRENLRTKSEAEARSKLQPVEERVEALFQQAFAQVAAQDANVPALPALPVSRVPQLIAAWRERERSRRVAIVMKGPYEGAAAFRTECKLIGACGEMEAVEPQEITRWVIARLSAITAKVEEIARAESLLVTSSDPAFGVFRSLVEKTWTELLEEEALWRRGDFTSLADSHVATLPGLEEAQATPAAVSAKPAQPSASGPLLSEAFEVWAEGGKARGAKKPSSGTVREARAALHDFIELHGDLPIQVITRKHGREFRDTIELIPQGLPKRLRDLPLPDLVNRLALTKDATPEMRTHAAEEHMTLSERRKVMPRTVGTINKAVGALGWVLSRAERDGHFDDVEAWRNPFDVPLVSDDRDEENHEAFGVAELNTLLASPVFSKGERPRAGRGDTASWVPLAAMMHGARRGELLQLYVRDVYEDADSGVWAFRFDRDWDRTVKSKSSIRVTPIHPQLINLGFLDFVRERRISVGLNASLWPGFEDRAKLQSRINKWGEWFNAYLADHVVNHPMKKFHSFRGTFKRFAFEADVEEGVVDRLVGHAPKTVGAKRYGRQRGASGHLDSGMSLSRLQRDMSRITFDGVDFSKVRQTG